MIKHKSIKYKNKYLYEKNKYLKIMTYNLCWEALEGKYSKPNLIKKSNGLNMEHCNIQLDNKPYNICLMNMIEIINNKLNEDYDFLCFQEINLNNFNQMKDTLNLNNYNNIITPSKNKNVDMITLYNYKKYELLKQYPKQKIYDYDINDKSNLNDNSDKSARPFQISLYKNKIDKTLIILINVHMPHIYKYDTSINNKNFNYDHIYTFNKIKKYMDKLIDNNEIDNFILCGDFNFNEPFKLFNFNDILNINFINDKLIKTCCYLNNDKILNYKKYQKSYDHIFISNHKYNNMKYDTLNENDLLKYSNTKHFISDHLPLFSEYYYDK